MNVVLQISDTHFGTEVPPVVDALLELTQREQPNVVVWTGDVTQRARRKQFAAATRFAEALAPWTQRVLVLPGNHDIPLFDLPTRLRDPYGRYRNAFGTSLETCYETEHLLVQCINTTRWYRRKDGEVSEEQIARVAERLRRAHPKQLRIVATHQPLQAIRDSDLRNLLRGYADAARTWSHAGADILMGGHIHLPYIRALHAELRERGQHTWIVQAGTAVSKRIREGVPNSLNLIRYAADGSGVCTVERWDYAADTRRFRRVESHELPLTREESPSDHIRLI